ncbi:30S ribosomal protein S6 [Buchnera aphidicola]|uniref:30S ribosomal protein S6 n=1 Tax=Buchnera aphidicola TaxID=9 RepID=UPI003463C190
MRHYEIVFMIHPDQTSEKVVKIINGYKVFITNNKGFIHRLEDWGRRQLAYSVEKFHKAYYVLMNIEVKKTVILKLQEKFRFDKIIIRNLIMKIKDKVTSISPMLKMKDDKKKILK